MITVDYLKAELASLKQQHANAVIVQHQAMGAILLIENLLSMEESSPKDSLTFDELKDALGAQSVELIEEPK